MKRLILAWLLFLGGILCLSQQPRAQFGAFPPGVFANKAALDPAAGGGGCSQATTFLARTSGLSGTETTAYTNMICGMVTDGLITGDLSTTGCGSLFDGLYIFATNTTTTANLNICGTSFPITVGAATVSFSADHGYTGDGVGGYLTTSFTPLTSGGNWVQNSAHVGAYVLTSRTSGAAMIEIGTSTHLAVYSYIEPLTPTPNLSAEMNGGTFPSAANSNAQGHWLVSRTGSSAITVYKNGSSFASPSDASTGVPNSVLFVCALDDSGATDFSTDQLSSVYFGSGVSSGQATAIDNRINGYMTALGINVH